MPNHLVNELVRFMRMVTEYTDRGRAYVLSKRQVEELTIWDHRILRVLNSQPTKELSFRDTFNAIQKDSDRPIHASTLSQAIRRLDERYGLLYRDYLKYPKNPRIALTDKGRETGRCLIRCGCVCPSFFSERVGSV